MSVIRHNMNSSCDEDVVIAGIASLCHVHRRSSSNRFDLAPVLFRGDRPLKQGDLRSSLMKESRCRARCCQSRSVTTAPDASLTLPAAPIASPIFHSAYISSRAAFNSWHSCSQSASAAAGMAIVINCKLLEATADYACDPNKPCAASSRPPLLAAVEALRRWTVEWTQRRQRPAPPSTGD